MSRVRADTIVNKDGDGAPNFPSGFTATGEANINTTGIITSTSFVGDLTGNVTGVGTITGGTIVATAGTITTLSATTVTIGGTLTYEDVTNIDSVGLITARTGVKVTAGGIDITAGGIEVGGISTFAGSLNTFANEVNVTAGGAEITAGGAKVSAGIVTISTTTDSTTSTTGALTVAGGVGVAKNLNVGISVTIAPTGIATFSQGMKVGGGNPLQEKVHINTTAWSASVAAGDINLDYGNVHLNTAVLAGTGNTLNVTSGSGINTSMGVGEIIAVTGITSVSATTAFVNTLKIDHTAVQVAWVGGSTPTAGGSSGYDTYAFNIIKTASAKYAVIGNHIKAG